MRKMDELDGLSLEQRIARIEMDVYRLYTIIQGVHDDKGIEARIIEIERYLFDCETYHNPHPCGNISHKHKLHGLVDRVRRLEDDKFLDKINRESDVSKRASIERDTVAQVLLHDKSLDRAGFEAAVRVAIKSQ